MRRPAIACFLVLCAGCRGTVNDYLLLARKGDQEEVRDAIQQIGELLHAKEAEGYSLGEGDWQAVEYLKAAALGHRDFVSRMAALSALAELKDPRADDVFLQALADEQWGVRFDAAKALTRHQPQGASATLATSLEKEVQPEVRLYIIKALINIADREALRVLLDVFLDHGERFQHNKLNAYDGIRRISGLDIPFEDTERWEAYQEREFPRPAPPTRPPAGDPEGP
ncbi:MAG: HEAT repeat domain-containing protein [Planctomycetota bacterium]|nr:HEAT repeat domain-containing protein [Planctomycetota bacterium]